jgi:hypothetical protein
MALRRTWPPLPALTVMTGAGSSLPSSPRNCSARKMGAPSPSRLSLNSCGGG